MSKEGKRFFAEIKEQVEKDQLFLIVYYGASTTSQESIFPNWGEIIRYVLKDKLTDEIGDYKKAYWNLQTLNLGLDGASSIDLLKRFEDLVLEKKPNLIILEASKNDVYYKIDKKTSEINNRKIIQKALDKGIKLVFIKEIPSLREDLNKKISDYLETDKKVADEFKDNKGFIFIDLFNLFPKNLLKRAYTRISMGGNPDVGFGPGEVDPVHYNRFGSAIVAKIILKEAFGIDFNEEKFLKDLDDSTKKYPDF